MRRMPRGFVRPDFVYFAAGRIHAAADLQPVEQSQACLPRRSPAAARTGGRPQSGRARRSSPDPLAHFMTADCVIDVRDLHKRYGKRKVVDGLTLAVTAGEI